MVDRSTPKRTPRADRIGGGDLVPDPSAGPTGGPSADLATDLTELARRVGIDALGFTTADVFVESRAVIDDRKARGLHGGMHFTYGRPERSTAPARSLDGARSLVVAARSYLRTEPEPPDPAHRFGRIAAYQWDDHYDHLRQALDALADHLRSCGYSALVLVDDNRLVDRAAAHRAGLGWFGKNTSILLEDAGSMFVLGSVLTDADLPAAEHPMADGCGPCNRCQVGCPTGALDVAGELDARRCLAWLVQADGVFPIEFRSALGHRLYGCDDCQDVCPPNRVRFRRSAEDAPVALAERVHSDVVSLLALDDDELMQTYGQWYIPRRQPDYLRRNALVVLGNVGDPDDPEVSAVLADALGSSSIVAAHAVWAARRLGRDDLVALADPADPLVQTELARPVDPRPDVAGGLAR